MARFFWIAMAVIGGGLVLLIVNDSAGRTFGIDNDDFGRLIWLGLFALVIGSALVRSGQMGPMARSLGIWVLMVLALIAGYQYRYELQDIASRVSAGLIPGSPLMIGEADGRQTVTLDKSANGHFEARIEINGASVNTVVDTGATSTVLTSQDAMAAGFNTAALNYTVPISTANGNTNAAAVRTDEIAIGGIVRRDMPVLVAAPGTLDQSLLGMNFIGSLSGFDVRGDRMVLRD